MSLFQIVSNILQAWSIWISKKPNISILASCWLHWLGTGCPMFFLSPSWCKIEISERELPEVSFLVPFYWELLWYYNLKHGNISLGHPVCAGPGQYPHWHWPCLCLGPGQTLPGSENWYFQTKHPSARPASGQTQAQPGRNWSGNTARDHQPSLSVRNNTISASNNFINRPPLLCLLRIMTCLL